MIVVAGDLFRYSDLGQQKPEELPKFEWEVLGLCHARAWIVWRSKEEVVVDGTPGKVYVCHPRMCHANAITSRYFFIPKRMHEVPGMVATLLSSYEAKALCS